MKNVLAAIACIVALVFMGVSVPALANSGGGEPTPCVPRDAYTETIQHPAQTHIERMIDKPGTPAVAEVWANFSPNKKKGTFVGPPTWPNDPRGTWNVKPKIPAGHSGPDGVYFQGNPEKGGNWFYRQAGKPAVPPTYKDVVVVDKEAWTEKIVHEAVVCETETPTTETPVTETPTPTDNPTTETPVDSEYITPSWSIKVDCSLPLKSWIVAPSTKQYDVDVKQIGESYQFELTFNIVAGDFKFATGDYEVSNDGKTALATVMLPVVRCVPPKTPQTPESETKCSAHKCVKIVRDGSGKVVEREVIKYGSVNEEGL